MVLDAFLRLRLVRTSNNPGTDEKDSNNSNSSINNNSKIEAERKPQTKLVRHHNHHHRVLLTYSEIPSWCDANPYIITGYRPVSQSFKASLASWTYLHNESCNIYTHLIPGIALLLGQGVLYHHTRAREDQFKLSTVDWGVLSLHLLTASVCLLISAFFHTLSNHSERTAHRWLQFDYVGILTLTLGNFVSGVHFGFYCETRPKVFYWSLIMTSSVITAVALLSPKFRGPRFRSLRLSSFICTGLLGVLPVAHMWIVAGSSKLGYLGVPYYILEGLLLFIGCFFWERRFPERLYPGKFDIWAHSHTIWHIFVAASIGAHVCGLLNAVDYTYQSAWCRV